ncbi:MAG: rRNA maturation RNase YbeY [Gammaproteobacteria bacterium]|nr:rRNA maturation RNase YbeY [Gammaproteobacteria bacterium]
MAAEAGDPVALEIHVDRAAGDEAGLAAADFRAWVLAALHAAGASPTGSLTVRLVGDDEGQRLNAQWRGKPGATNVLAFPGPDPAVLPPGVPAELGDLVICLPVVLREAGLQGKTALAHLAHLVVHGTLHLLGHTHDDEVSAGRMETLETRILTALGYPDPYILCQDTSNDGAGEGAGLNPLE